MTVAPAGARPGFLASAWRRLATAIACGALSALALPPLGWFPFGLILYGECTEQQMHDVLRCLCAYA